MSAVKEGLAQLARELPEDVTWDQAREALEVLEMYVEAMKDKAEGRTISDDDLRRKFGLPTRSEA